MAFIMNLGMFDKDQSGQIDLNEFQGLWNYIMQWKSTFDQYDRDRSGFIDTNEFHYGNVSLFPHLYNKLRCLKEVWSWIALLIYIHH